MSRLSKHVGRPTGGLFRGDTLRPRRRFSPHLLGLSFPAFASARTPPLIAVHPPSSWFRPLPTFLTPPRSFRSMFTPPPSPLPPQGSSSDQLAPAVSPEASPNAALKRKGTSRMRWSVLAVPAVLVLITLTTRYISHPVLFDPISGLPREPYGSAEFNNLGHHKRHPGPQHPPVPHVVRANNDPSPSVTTVPTIPVSPPLPTPFPQPFDTTLSKNFSTQTCVDFYNNMTLSLPFRQCRPFGLLAQYSSQFIDVSPQAISLPRRVNSSKAGTDQRDIVKQHDLGHL